MAHLHLSLAIGPYDLPSALIEGKARASGVDFDVMTMASPARHGRMVRQHGLRVSDLSLVSSLVGREAAVPFPASPVCPTRRLRQGFAVKRTGCAMEMPADLNGRRVG